MMAKSPWMANAPVNSPTAGLCAEPKEGGRFFELQAAVAAALSWYFESI